jgi:hypothetical protein
MKKIIITFLIAAVCTVSLFGTETGGSFTIGNNNLTAAPLTTAVFPGTEFPWGTSLYWTKEANESSGIEVGFLRDPILRNIGYTNFYYSEDLFSIEVGPFFGVFNSLETLIKSGISTEIRVNIPGIAFADFSTRSTIGGRLSAAGDYIQEANNISVGFYLYNAICTVAIDTKSYGFINTSLVNYAENFTEYSFSADLFQKNIPYTVELKLAYQERVRTIDQTSIQSLNTIVLGTDISISPLEFLSVCIGIESSLYSFGFMEDTVAATKELLTFSSTFPGNFLFNASAGFSIDLDKLTR